MAEKDFRAELDALDDIQPEAIDTSTPTGGTIAAARDWFRLEKQREQQGAVEHQQAAALKSAFEPPASSAVPASPGPFTPPVREQASSSALNAFPELAALRETPAMTWPAAKTHVLPQEDAERNAARMRVENKPAPAQQPVSSPPASAARPQSEPFTTSSLMGEENFIETPVPDGRAGNQPWGFMKTASAQEEVRQDIATAEAGIKLLEQERDAFLKSPAPRSFTPGGEMLNTPDDEKEYLASIQRGIELQQQRVSRARMQIAASEAGKYGIGTSDLNAPLPVETPWRSKLEGAFRGALEPVASVPRYAGMLSGWIDTDIVGHKEPRVLSRKLLDAGNRIDEYVKEKFPTDLARQEEFGQKLANLAGFMATIYGAGALTAVENPGFWAKAGQLVTTGSLSAAPVATQHYDAAIEAMRQQNRPLLPGEIPTPEQQRIMERDAKIASLWGAGAGLTMLIPLGSVMATTAERTAGGIMAESLRGAGISGTQMTAFNVMNNVIARQYYDQNRAWNQGMGDDMLIGVLLGAVTHGFNAAAYGLTPEQIQMMRDAPPADRSTWLREKIAGLTPVQRENFFASMRENITPEQRDVLDAWIAARREGMAATEMRPAVDPFTEPGFWAKFHRDEAGGKVSPERRADVQQKLLEYLSGGKPEQGAAAPAEPRPSPESGSPAGAPQTGAGESTDPGTDSTIAGMREKGIPPIVSHRGGKTAARTDADAVIRDTDALINELDQRRAAAVQQKKQAAAQPAPAAGAAPSATAPKTIIAPPPPAETPVSQALKEIIPEPVVEAAKEALPRELSDALGLTSPEAPAEAAKTPTAAAPASTAAPQEPWTPPAPSASWAEQIKSYQAAADKFPELDRGTAVAAVEQAARASFAAEKAGVPEAEELVRLADELAAQAQVSEASGWKTVAPAAAPEPEAAPVATAPVVQPEARTAEPAAPAAHVNEPAETLTGGEPQVQEPDTSAPEPVEAETPEAALSRALDAYVSGEIDEGAVDTALATAKLNKAEWIAIAKDRTGGTEKSGKAAREAIRAHASRQRQMANRLKQVDASFGKTEPLPAAVPPAARPAPRGDAAAAQEIIAANPQMERTLTRVRDMAAKGGERAAEGLRDILHLDNKVSRRVFEAATGVKLPKTQAGTMQAIDEWGGITPERRAEINAARDRAVSAERDLAREKELGRILSGMVDSKTGATVKETIDRLISEGYNRVEQPTTKMKVDAYGNAIEEIKGKQWWLLNAEGRGFNISKMKGAAKEIREYAQLVIRRQETERALTPQEAPAPAEQVVAPAATTEIAALQAEYDALGQELSDPNVPNRRAKFGEWQRLGRKIDEAKDSLKQEQAPQEAAIADLRQALKEPAPAAAVPLVPVEAPVSKANVEALTAERDAARRKAKIAEILDKVEEGGDFTPEEAARAVPVIEAEIARQEDAIKTLNAKYDAAERASNSRRPSQEMRKISADIISARNHVSDLEEALEPLKQTAEAYAETMKAQGGLFEPRAEAAVPQPDYLSAKRALETAHGMMSDASEAAQKVSIPLQAKASMRDSAVAIKKVIDALSEAAGPIEHADTWEVANRRIRYFKEDYAPLRRTLEDMVRHGAAQPDSPVGRALAAFDIMDRLSAVLDGTATPADFEAIAKQEAAQKLRDDLAGTKPIAEIAAKAEETPEGKAAIDAAKKEGLVAERGGELARTPAAKEPVPGQTVEEKETASGLKYTVTTTPVDLNAVVAHGKQEAPLATASTEPAISAAEAAKDLKDERRLGGKLDDIVLKSGATMREAIDKRIEAGATQIEKAGKGWALVNPGKTRSKFSGTAKTMRDFHAYASLVLKRVNAERAAAALEPAAPPSEAPVPEPTSAGDARTVAAIDEARSRGVEPALAVTEWASRIEATRGTEQFNTVVAKLNDALNKAQMVQLANLAGNGAIKPLPKTVTKKAALQSIIDRHNDVAEAKRLSDVESEDARERLRETARRDAEKGVSEIPRRVIAERDATVTSPDAWAAGSGDARNDLGEHAGEDQRGQAPAVPESGERAGSHPARGKRNGAGGSGAGPAANAGVKRKAAPLTDEQREAVRAQRQIAEQARIDRAARNYVITEADAIGQGSPKGKVAANIAAISTLKTIQLEEREATEAEKQVLVKYTGWGAFAQQMFDRYGPHREKWAAERKQLEVLLTPEEYEAARASTLNAHYTSADVIQGMWDVLGHMGFKGGRALEPSAGAGHFIGLTPENMRASTSWTAVELDQITGGILKALYGGTDVRAGQGYETVNWPDNFFDLAISNVPFGSYRLRDTRYKTPMLIHDYFFVKSLDKVRPGGIVAFITSAGTLDKAGEAARNEIASRATFLGAIRLPGGSKGAFASNAGTDVTTDIIFLRKKLTGEPEGDRSWLHLKEVQTPEGPANINAYFASNPEMMLGEMRLTGSMYGKNEPVLIGDNTNLRARIAEAGSKLLKDAIVPRERSREPVRLEVDAATDGIKEGTFYAKGKKLFRKVNGVGVEQSLPPKDDQRLRAMMGMRDTVNALFEKQASGEREGRDKLRTKLNEDYDKFVKEHGPINKTEVKTAKNGRVTRKYPNLKHFKDDADFEKVSAIEAYDENTGEATKRAIFSRDILSENVTPEITGPGDALAVVLNEKGFADMADIARRFNMTEDEAAIALGDAVYLDPNGDRWQTASQYLSGDVVTKLNEARAAAETNPDYARNIAALEAVQPIPLVREEIAVPAGAPWIPEDVVTQFLREHMGVYGRLEASISPATGKWVLIGDKKAFPSSARQTYGTRYKRVDEIFLAAFNGTQIVVAITDSDGKRVVLSDETEIANARVEALREAFMGPEGSADGWIWQDEARAQRIEALYNQTFNRIVNADYDGSHLTFPGMVNTITDNKGNTVPFELRQHQKNAVWRVIQKGNALLAHVVGSGKTFSMITAAMEQKRLGLVQRPMFVVRNNMLEQFAKDFRTIYPNANLLVTQKDDVSPSKRKEFAARAASHDWDAIIITQSSFGRMPMSTKAYREHAKAYLDQVIETYELAAAEEGKKSRTVKDLEKIKNSAADRLKKLMHTEAKDDGTEFEALGIDQLIVDEFHDYKNLALSGTRFSRVKGIKVDGSQRAEDMFMKIGHLEKVNPGRSIIAATGTPISNTLGEVFVLQRYLQLQLLQSAGLDTFDKWASTFGRITTRVVPDALSGGKVRSETSMSNFFNLPELVHMFAEVADFQTADMLQLPRPDLEGGKSEVVQADMSPVERGFMGSLIDRAEAVRGRRVDPAVDNMLKINSEGMKAAVDMRLLDPDAPFNPEGKIAVLVKNVADIYHNGKEPAMAQLIFLGMGVPKAEKKAKAAAAGEEPEGEGEGQDVAVAGDDTKDMLYASNFNLYEDLLGRLVEAGIPRDQIATIYDAKTPEAKTRLEERVRQGEIRVLLGTPEKMGVGLNVQTRLKAIHRVDPPWKPSDLEQMAGRVLRQGNLNKEVRILDYASRGSIDAWRWDKLEKKARWLDDFYRSAGTKSGISRSTEDITEALPQAAEMRAAATDDPRMIELITLDREAKLLSLAKASHDRSVRGAKSAIIDTNNEIQRRTEFQGRVSADAAKVTDTSGGNFAMEVGGLKFTERKEAGEHLMKMLLGNREIQHQYGGAPIQVAAGTIGGLKAVIETKGIYTSDGRLTLMKPVIEGEARYENDNVGFGYRLTSDADPLQIIRAFERLLKGVPEVMARTEEAIARLKKDIPRLEKQAAKGAFPKADALARAENRIKTIMDAMKAESQAAAKPAPGTASDPTESFAFSDPLESFALAAKVREQGQPVFALPGFYSPAVRAAENVRQEKATGEQWLKMISKAPGVKQDELDWMGLKDWLDGQKGAVTKSEVLDYMRSHQVDLEEKTLTSANIEAIARDKFNEDFSESAQGGRGSGTLNEWIYDYSRDLREAYDIKHGKNAHEDASPVQIVREAEGQSALDRLINEAFDNFKDDYITATSERIHEDARYEGRNIAEFETYKVPGGENYREILLRLPALEGKYESNHFNDQEVVHMRVDDRIGPNGEKVLFVNEVQSDLHQTGRRSGYASPDEISRLERAETDLSSFNESMVEKYGSVYSYANLSDAERRRWDSLRRDVSKLKHLNEYSPNAPFKGDLWLELAMKNALRYAVEHGYDAVSWARSDQIAKAVGGDADALSVQYDQKIGRFLDKYTKKWGGKVGTTQLLEFARAPGGAARPGWTEAEGGVVQGQVVPGKNQILRITTEMRQSIGEHGQPLFRLPSEAGDTRLPPILEGAVPEIAAELERQLRTMLPPDVAVRVLDRVFSGGREVAGVSSAGARLIKVALRHGPSRALDPERALEIGQHEVTHMLLDLGLLTAGEESLLLERASKIGITINEPAYRAHFAKKAADMGLEGAEAESWVQRRMDRELIAHLAERFESGRAEYGSRIDGLLARLRGFLAALLRAIRNATGFRNWRDVAEDITSGRMAARGEPNASISEAGAQRGREAAETGGSVAAQTPAMGRPVETGGLPVAMGGQPGRTGRSAPTRRFRLGNGYAGIVIDNPSGPGGLGSRTYRVYSIGNAAELNSQTGPRAHAMEVSNGVWQVILADLRSGERDLGRRGLGQKLYDAIEADTGGDVVPSKILGPQSYRFWQKRDARAVRDFRQLPFEANGEWHSPDGLRDQMAVYETLLASETRADRISELTAERDAVAEVLSSIPQSSDPTESLAVPPVPPEPENIKPLREILKGLKSALGMTTTQGVYRRFTVRGLATGRELTATSPGTAFRAQYDRMAGAARVRIASDIEAISHEGGHHLERLLGKPLETLKEEHRSELEPLAGNLQGTALSEGFAEFFRQYITARQQAQALAPEFYRAFESLLDARNPAMRDQLDTVALTLASEDYRRYMAASALDQVKADIVSNVKDQRTLNDTLKAMGQDLTTGGWFTKAFAGAIDEGHPAYIMVQALLNLADANGVRSPDGKPISLAHYENPSKLLRQMPDTFREALSWGKNGMPNYRQAENTWAVFKDGKFLQSFTKADDAARFAQQAGGKVRANQEYRSASLWGAVTHFAGRESYTQDHLDTFDAYLLARRAVAEFDRWENKQRIVADLTRQIGALDVHLNGAVPPGMKQKHGGLREGVRKIEDAVTRRKNSIRTHEAILRRTEGDLSQAMAEERKAIEKPEETTPERLSEGRAEQRRAMLRARINVLAERVDASRMLLEKLRTEREDLEGRLEYETDLLKKVERRADDLLTLRRRTLENGIQRQPFRGDRAKFASTITEVEVSNPRAFEAAQMVYDFVYQTAIHDFQAGFITKETLDAYGENKDYYVPARRDMSDLVSEGRAFGGRAAAKKHAPSKAFGGSWRDVMSPLETIMELAYHRAAKTLINDITRSMADLAERAGPGGADICELMDKQELVERDPDGLMKIRDGLLAQGFSERDADEMVMRIAYDFGDMKYMLITRADKAPIAPLRMPVWRNGELNYLRLNDPEWSGAMFNAMNGLGRDMTNMVIDVMATPATLIQGTVWSSLGFMARHAFRTVEAAAIMTGDLTNPKTWPVINQLRGAYHLALGTREAKLYQETGGSMGGVHVAALSHTGEKANLLALREKGITVNPKPLIAGMTVGGTIGGLVLGPIGVPMGMYLGGALHRETKTLLASTSALTAAGAAAGGPVGAAAGLGLGLLLNRGTKHFIETGAHISDVVEMATRLGVFSTAMKTAIKNNPALTPYQAGQEAAFVARNIFDGSRRGSKMLAMLRIVPFMNAHIQHVVSSAEIFMAKHDRGYAQSIPKMAGVFAAGAAAGGAVAGPLGAVAAGQAAVTGVTFAMAQSELLRRMMGPMFKHTNRERMSDNERRAIGDSAKMMLNLFVYTALAALVRAMMSDDPEYRLVNAKLRNQWHPIKLGDTWFKMPKPFQFGLPSTIWEASWDYQFENDPRFAERVKEAAFETLIPPATPQGFTLWRDIGSNTNSLTGREIVPQYLQHRPPQEQFRANTSQIAIQIAGAINSNPVLKASVEAFGRTVFRRDNFEFSPLLADYMITQGFGYWGRDAQKASDVAAGRATRAADFPFIGSMVQQFQLDPYRVSEATRDFFDQAARANGKYVRAKDGYLAMVNDLRINMTPEEKEAKANAYLAAMPNDERDYALVENFGTSSERRMNPIQRLRDIHTAVYRMQQELSANTLQNTEDKQATTPIPVSVDKARDFGDLITKYFASEAENTMIFMGQHQYAHRPELDAKGTLAVLKAMAPEVGNELERRLERAHVQDWTDVKNEWPEVAKDMEQRWRESLQAGEPMSGGRSGRRYKQAPSGNPARSAVPVQ